MAGNEEELKKLLMTVKEESEKVGLNLNIKETKIMASGPITSWQIEGCGVGSVLETCMQVRKQQLELTWNNRLVSNRKRSAPRLYIVTVII